MKIWKLEDIHKLPEFGGDIGWFYGLVKHHETNRIWIYEIFPGVGYATAIDRYTFYDPKIWWMIIKDIIKS
jgi:hypothetical protein